MSKRYRSKKEAMRVRRDACAFAAQVLAGRPDEALIPKLWSITVFFECYMTGGCDRTYKDFGPKEPAQLKAAK